MKMLPEFDRVLRDHGIAILTGILRDQDEDVREVVHRCRFNVFEEITQGEWLALIVEKHGG